MSQPQNAPRNLPGGAASRAQLGRPLASNMYSGIDTSPYGMFGQNANAASGSRPPAQRPPQAQAPPGPQQTRPANCVPGELPILRAYGNGPGQPYVDPYAFVSYGGQGSPRGADPLLAELEAMSPQTNAQAGVQTGAQQRTAPTTQHWQNGLSDPGINCYISHGGRKGPPSSRNP